MKVSFQVLGCRLNEAEVEIWSRDFNRFGHSVCNDPLDANCIVLNSCSVTAEADRKSRQLINRLKRDNPDAKLVLTGCYASLQAEKIKQDLSVDLLIDNREKDQLAEKVLSHLDLTDSEIDPVNQDLMFERGRHRAFIKIQDGCRYRCTFCIVTVARGEERSRSIQEIVDEVNFLEQQGVKEIVLTGVHVGGYGSDIGKNLYVLVAEILDKTNVPRIRLASVEPWELDKQFLSLFSDARLMPHMHLPLQSGSDSVLRRMSRRCKTTDFAGLIEQIKSMNPGFNITTDLIVGFPGETEQEWQETVNFVSTMPFGHMHIFSYSGRAGTKAAGLPNQVENKIKKLRSREMHEIAARLKQQAMQEQLGNRSNILWENEETNGQGVRQRFGYTSNYFKVSSQFAPTGNSVISTMKIHSIASNHSHLTAFPAA